MFPSLQNLLTAAAAFSATAYALPQAGGDASLTTPTSASASASFVAAAASSTSTGTACNNSPDLCDRKYSNVTHMGAHDAGFLRDASTDNSIAGNQYFNATIALDAGIRLLQTQVHNLNGTLEMCHTTCDLLDGGTLQAWLEDIKYWMDQNTNDVVTILIVNSDDESVDSYGTVFEASGIDEYGYTPSGTDWPTLQTMIDNDERLVTFIADISTSSSYTYLLSEWDYVFETAFGVTSAAGFNCTLDRGTSSSASSAVSAGYMGLINHFQDQAVISGVEIPAVSQIKTTNSPERNTTGALGKQAYDCYSEWAQAPTFVLVDFFNKGPAIDTADNINGITATGRTEPPASTSGAVGAVRGMGKTGLVLACLTVGILLA